MTFEICSSQRSCEFFVDDLGLIESTIISSDVLVSHLQNSQA